MKNAVPQDVIYDRVDEPESYKATLVSIVPFPIIEEKPGLIPGHFELEASTDGRPRVQHIGECTHFVWIDEVRGSLRVRNPSYMIAQSVVRDYMDGQMGARPDSHPGLFWLPGILTPRVIEEKHADRLEEVRRKQQNWFIELVKLGDDAWQQTRQHQSISDEQRYAARAIDPENKQQRPWIFVAKNEVSGEMTGSQGPKMVICKACGSDVIDGVVLCRYCGCVFDHERYAAMTFAKQAVAAAGVDFSRLGLKQ